MKNRPAGLSDESLVTAIAAEWRISPVLVRYLPVGFGSYHWHVQDSIGKEYFVTADGIRDQRAATSPEENGRFALLRTTMETAHALETRSGLTFVVGPIPTASGAVIHPIDDAYAVAVFPFIKGKHGAFDQVQPRRERGAVINILAQLHAVSTGDYRAPQRDFAIAGRDGLNSALEDLDVHWRGGPYSERTRQLLLAHRSHLDMLLGRFDELSDHIANSSRTPVITHGEPHPGNIIASTNKLWLVDWDTVGLAPRERDLWHVTGPDGSELQKYESLTGVKLDRHMLEAYRLQWMLDDISIFVERLCTKHEDSMDVQLSWRALKNSLSLQ